MEAERFGTAGCVGGFAGQVNSSAIDSDRLGNREWTFARHMKSTLTFMPKLLRRKIASSKMH